LNEEVVTKLPVLIVLPLMSGITTPNVELSPFVNVNVFPLNEAVIKDDAVIDELTNPNAVICAEEDIVPAGVAPPKDDVATNVVLPAALPTYVNPCCKDAVKLPERNKSPAVFIDTPIELPKPSCKSIKVADAVLLVAKCISD
jgi:hypothetical protein